MRAQFMQNKYGKSNTSSNESSLLQLEAANKINTSQMSSLQSASKVHSEHLIEEQKKSESSPLTISNLQDASMHNKLTSNAEEPPQKKCKRVQIPWQSPPGNYLFFLFTVFNNFQWLYWKNICNEINTSLSKGIFYFICSIAYTLWKIIIIHLTYFIARRY